MPTITLTLTTEQLNRLVKALCAGQGLEGASAAQRAAFARERIRGILAKLVQQREHEDAIKAMEPPPDLDVTVA